MKHSNIYYISKLNDARQVEFVKVDGVAVKNSYGFDLFRYKHPTKLHYVISDGITGVKICDILPGSKSCESVTSHHEIDAFLAQYHQIDRIHKYEKLQNYVEQMKEQGNLTPRYTNPDERRPVKEKVTNPDIVLSKCLYESGKKYFVRIHNQDGIQLFKRKDNGDEPYFTVYAPSNGWMITLGQVSCLNEHIAKLKDGFDIYAWILGVFEKQIADPLTWADTGLADYLDRRNEADEHNVPLKAEREARIRQDAKDRENKLKASELEKTEKYNTAIANAVQAIRNNEKLVNTDIKTMTGNETSIILELMRIYHIEVPLKTRGWIKSALAQIIFKEGAYTYSYYTKSRDSTVFRDYLEKLVYAINA